MQSVRPAAVAGMFYSDHPAELARDVEAMLAVAEAGAPQVEPKALIVPHAGYVYSGPIAASAYCLLKPTEDFYVKLTSAHLQPVLDTLAYVHHETDCWLEITTLLIPGYNDSSEEIGKLSAWVAKELGSDVPLHFSAFHPDWKMPDVPATPPATLTRARKIALDAGLHYVYTGNVHNAAGDTTYCPHCRHAVIVRDWYDIRQYNLTPQGACPQCGSSIAGRFGAYDKPFGPRRIPVNVMNG